MECTLPLLRFLAGGGVEETKSVQSILSTGGFSTKVELQMTTSLLRRISSEEDELSRSVSSKVEGGISTEVEL